MRFICQLYLGEVDNRKPAGNSSARLPAIENKYKKTPEDRGKYKDSH